MTQMRCVSWDSNWFSINRNESDLEFQGCVKRGRKLTGTEGSTGNAGYLAAAFLFCCLMGQLMQTCPYKGLGGGIRHVL